jgi:large subunit ribosomal protein L24e
MAKCTFCGSNIEKGTGKSMFMVDGKTLHFCRRKCEKNMIKLGRNPRDIKWTAEHKIWKDMRMAAEKQAKSGAAKTETKAEKKAAKKKK